MQAGNHKALASALRPALLEQVFDRHDPKPEGHREKVQLKQKIKAHVVLLRGCEKIERRSDTVSRCSQRNAAAGVWRRSQ
ncbi:hypothetical protein D9M68_387990 [compost metagenome]